MKSLTTKNFMFADFELDRAKRLLLKHGKPVALNSKTFDLLEALVERRGEIIGKDELLEKIWAGQFVEESNLTVHVSTLRKILGETRGENRFIATVPGKGYKFVGEPNEAADESADEITIENHSFSRIVVAEEIEEVEESDWQKPAPQTERGIEGQINASFLPRQIAAPEERQSRFKKHRIIVGLLAIIALLITVGGGYVWRQRQNISSADAPFAQMQIRQLTNNGKVRRAALSPDGKLFAYVTDDFGRQSLWIGQTDGGNNIQLRPPTDAVYHALAFSKDNDSLYFSVRDEANPSYALFRLPVFGGAQEKIRDRIGSFALAADGKQIAFVRRNTENKKDDLIVSDLSGAAEERIIASLPPFSVVADSVSVSPDGLFLAYGAESGEFTKQLFTAQISNGEVKRISPQNFGEIEKTVWLADGDGLILTAVEAKAWAAVQQYCVWHVALPGGETRKITSDLSSYGGSLAASKDVLLTIESRQLNNVWVAPADDLSRAKQITTGSFGKYDGLWGLDWLPDGRIVFNSSDTHSQVISVMNADGGSQKQLTAPGHIDSDLDVSEDGRYIVFHSTRGGGFDIWRMDANGDSLKQLTFDKKSYQPFVSPDSRFVYYKGWENGTGGMRRVSIDGGETVALTDKETSWVSVSPDGKYIAGGYRTDKSRLAVLPIDGGSPIKQFDFPKTATMYGGSRWTPDGKSVVYHDSAYGYWQQPIEGGESRRIENLPKEKLYNFAWSNDGKQFAFVRGTEIRDVVLLRSTKNSD
jgi:DNA-binding winged helix-turn-helix (wHTH) protein/Tol biopolymer transport system component